MKRSREPEVSRRFRVLLEQMLESYGDGHKAKVAAALGLDPTDVSKVLNGKRRIGHEVAMRACESTGLDPAWFSMPWPSDSAPPHFSNFIRVEADRGLPVAPQKGVNFVQLRKRARGVFEAGARGRPFEPSKAILLATEVLDMDLVEAARKVLASPPDRIREKAFALADAILEIPVRDVDSSEDDDLVTLRDATPTQLEETLTRRRAGYV